MDFNDLKEIYLFSLSHFLKIPLVKPDYVGILLTNRCNLKCKMCDIRKNPTSPEEELSLVEIKEIVDDVSNWGVDTITLSGGEPFLRKDFFRIANYATKEVEHVAINTNLTLINEEVAKKICDLPYHKFHLEISLDGATPKTHDGIRGTPGSFEKIMSGVEKIKKVSREEKTDVNMGVTVVLMEDNVGELMGIIELAQKYNFVNVSIMPVLISNKDVQERGDQPYMSKKNLKILDNTIDQVIEFKRNHGLIINPVTALKLYKQYFRGQLYHTGVCKAGYMGPNVVTNGNVVVCSYTIGDIRENDIKEIWFSKRAKEVRKYTSQCKRPCLQHYAIRFSESNPIKATYSYMKEKTGELFNRVNNYKNRIKTKLM